MDEVETGLERDPGVADDRGLLGDPLELLCPSLDVACVDQAAGELGLGEQRVGAVAGAAQDAAGVLEQSLRLLELTSTDEDLGDAGVRMCRSRAVACTKEVLARLLIEFHRFAPTTLCGCLYSDVEAEEPREPGVAEPAIDLERHP